jgi:hypothetical protein
MYLVVREDTPPQEQKPFSLYHYDPTIGGAVVTLLLFLATTMWHFWQLFRARCWFILPLAFGGICKTALSRSAHPETLPKNSD